MTGFIHGCKLKALFFMGVFLFTEITLWAAPNPLEIRIKKEVVVRGDTIYLGNIATFHPGNDGRVNKLKRIVVASAPAPGDIFRFNKRFLNYKVGSAVSGKGDIVLKVPASLEVRRAAQVITAREMETIFKEHIKSHSPWPEGKITFERINTPGDIALPEGTLSWEIQDKGDQHYVGNISAVINFQVNGKHVRKVPLSGRISISQQVVRAAGGIKKGELISKDDLVLVTENNIRIHKDMLTDLDSVIGKRAVRNIRPGQLVTSRMIEDPPLVKKGNRVIILAENQILKITTLGKALEDGRAGDQIRVINVSSGKEIFSTVKGPGLVEVAF